MKIWDNLSCGSNYGPKIEIDVPGYRCETLYHGPFHRGTVLIWDNNGENRWGAKNLGGVSGFQVRPFGIYDSYRRRYFGTQIFFRIIGGGGDDFCPKVLTIYCKDGKIYQSVDMNGWFDDTKGGNKWRKAYRKRS